MSNRTGATETVRDMATKAVAENRRVLVRVEGKEYLVRYVFNDDGHPEGPMLILEAGAEVKRR